MYELKLNSNDLENFKKSISKFVQFNATITKIEIRNGTKIGLFLTEKIKILKSNYKESLI